MMRYRPLAGYLVLVAILSTGIITAMKVIGEKGIYLAGVYLLMPVVEAIVARFTL